MSPAGMRHPSPSDEEKSHEASLDSTNARARRSDQNGEAAAKVADSAPFSPVREIMFILVICVAQFLALAGLAQSIAPLDIIGR